MAGLAGPEDYVARYTPPGDQGALKVLLDDASSVIRRESGLTISRVVDDVVTLDLHQRSRSVMLPEFPVSAVTSVVVDGVTVDPARYRARSWGEVEGRRGMSWPCDVDIVVTYTHGWDPVPDWVVGLVCSTVQRAIRPSAVNGVQGVTTGSQNVQYASSLAGVNLWLTRDELARVRGLRGVLVA